MEALVEEVLEVVVLVEDGKSNVLFSRELMNLDSDLLRYDGVEELFNYINNKDVEIEKVKALVTRANRELRPRCKQLYVRKASGRYKDVEHRICVFTI